MCMSLNTSDKAMEVTVSTSDLCSHGGVAAKLCSLPAFFIDIQGWPHWPEYFPCGTSEGFDGFVASLL